MSGHVRPLFRLAAPGHPVARTGARVLRVAVRIPPAHDHDRETSSSANPTRPRDRLPMGSCPQLRSRHLRSIPLFAFTPGNLAQEASDLSGGRTRVRRDPAFDHLQTYPVSGHRVVGSTFPSAPFCRRRQRLAPLEQDRREGSGFGWSQPHVHRQNGLCRIDWTGAALDAAGDRPLRSDRAFAPGNRTRIPLPGGQEPNRPHRPTPRRSHRGITEFIRGRVDLRP